MAEGIQPQGYTQRIDLTASVVIDFFPFSSYPECVCVCVCNTHEYSDDPPSPSSDKKTREMNEMNNVNQIKVDVI